MAQIKEFSSADLNTISRFGGVSNTLEKINGVTVVAAASFTGLLDTYTGAAAAYSTRRLASATTVLLRVRRDTGFGGTGDDDEADVAYDSNNELSLDSAISNASAGVTATTLGQFINVGTVGGTTYTNPDSLTVTASCFVDTWYDQASTNDVEQASHANQPQIHDGTVDTDLNKENSKPCLKFDSDKLGEVTVSLNQPFTSTMVMTSNGGADTFASVFGSRDGTGVKGAFIRRTTNWWMQSNLLPNTGQAHDTSQHLFYSVWDGANSEFAQDGATATTLSPGTTDWVNLAIGARGIESPDSGANGNYQELIFWSTDQSGDGNKSGIETDINGYFSIYT